MFFVPVAVEVRAVHADHVIHVARVASRVRYRAVHRHPFTYRVVHRAALRVVLPAADRVADLAADAVRFCYTTTQAAT